MSGAGVLPPPAAAASETFVAPLSFAQERLWFLDQVDPGTPLYTMAGALRLRGELDAGALERSLAEVIRRHEALRTTVRILEGEPAQVIAPFTGFRLEFHDLSALDPAAAEGEVARRAADEARRGFDLVRGPLLRAGLLRLGPREHVFLLAMHHVVGDAWSLRVLFAELGTLYPAFRANAPSPLPPLRLQYADYAAWQRQRLRGDTHERLAAWWREALRGAPTLLELPADRPRRADRGHEGGRVEADLDEGWSAAVAGLARAAAATPFMVLLAAFAALLGRHAGVDDVLVASPVANRARAELEPLIGLFVNTLALRVELQGDPTFRELVARVREMTLGAYEHQELPFERLVEELRPVRSLAHEPLAQVMFVLQNVPDSAPALPGVEVELLKGGSGVAKFDLMLSVFERNGRPAAALEYATDLFDADSAEALLERWRELVDEAVANPDRRVSELPLLSARERRAVRDEPARTARAYPGPWTVHELVSRQAARTPGAVALHFEGRTITYAELEAGANRLARTLRRLGAGPETRVGICAERSPEVVLLLLAVMKVGACYVPIDSAYPAERVSFLLRDAGVAVVAGEDALVDALPPHTAAALRLGRDAERIEAESAADPGVAVDPDSLAYVIYTSGSTGVPKGVAVPHRGVVNVLRWLDERFPHDGYERVLLKASLGFDASVWELFWPLAVGGSVVVARPDGHRDAEYLARTIARYGVSTVHFIPSMLPAFIEAAQTLEMPRLKRVICGGEALPAELMDRFHASLPAELYNWYGPTETSIGSVCWATTPGRERFTTPIGTPISNTVAYVLDPALRPVPAGVSGELCLGGVGVTRGYLGRPGLTADRFVPDPFSGWAGARLYRTGDRVRRRRDGDIEFLGRLDGQVKIRGLRIEPGEIEAALLAHPGVREAAVAVREDVPGDRRLVAYAVATAGAELGAGELRAHLARTLPEYMLPAAYVFLSSLPLGAAGKLDRHALPPPEGARPELEARYAEPATATERVVAAVWAELLGLERVGAEDPFFELGGHSLLLVQVSRRVHERLGVEVPVAELFRHPTVRDLAGHLDDGAGADRITHAAREAARRQVEAIRRRRPGSAQRREDA